MIARLLAALHRATCHHRCYLEDIARINPERVDCLCYQCGKKLTASYGLALRADLDQRAPTRRWFTVPHFY